MTPSISVITVTFNSLRCLQRLRESLRQPGVKDVEWLVIDNCSRRPETHELLREIEAAGEATVIRHDRNLWFTRGCNAGIAKAGGDLILLLNPDCALRPGALAAMVRTARRPRVGVVGALLVNEQGIVVHAGALDFGVHLGGEPLDPRAPWAQERRWEGWLTGACLMVTRAALDLVGGQLDEAYPHYHSDRILCERLREAGLEVWMSKAVILHSVGGSGQ
jgi:GT2 family glycosyltransferase